MAFKTTTIFKQVDTRRSRMTQCGQDDALLNSDCRQARGGEIVGADQQNKVSNASSHTYLFIEKPGGSFTSKQPRQDMLGNFDEMRFFLIRAFLLLLIYSLRQCEIVPL